ncbi:MAG TPA: MGMT family protein [Steroidobacter sp.]|jgi:methylated-DNA-protein-cysteine methyltransferase-like protein|nr:MGMT family protein [Steroidobacteraceae bacterium]HLS82597.1 MGMT family protein [Steroidobacter sp.]
MPRAPRSSTGRSTAGAKAARSAAGSSAERILEAVRRIPRGRVSTYGQVADAAGLPRRARLVGTVLRETSARVPWHRVVNAGGRISFPVGSDAYEQQRRRLEREKVVLLGGRIDLKRYGWPSREAQLDELLWRVY